MTEARSTAPPFTCARCGADISEEPPLAEGVPAELCSPCFEWLDQHFSSLNDLLCDPAIQAAITDGSNGD